MEKFKDFINESKRRDVILDFSYRQETDKQGSRLNSFLVEIIEKGGSMYPKVVRSMEAKDKFGRQFKIDTYIEGRCSEGFIDTLSKDIKNVDADLQIAKDILDYVANNLEFDKKTMTERLKNNFSNKINLSIRYLNVD